MNNQKFRLALLVFALCVSGCATIKDAAVRQQQAAELKTKNYENLRQAIETKMLKQGMSTRRVRQLFGEPDDIFSSGSTTGKFEVWAYERTSPQKAKGLDTIRLYFDNNRLVSWSY